MKYMELTIGQKLVCIRPAGSLKLHHEYVLKDVVRNSTTPGILRVILEDMPPSGYDLSRFLPVYDTKGLP